MRNALLIAAALGTTAAQAGWTEHGQINELNFGIDFVDSQHGWTSGAKDGIGPRINYSSNGGQSWTNQSSDAETMFWLDIDMANTQVGFACGLAALILRDSVQRTTNGGQTWVNVNNSSAITAFPDVLALDASNVIVSGLWTQFLQERQGIWVTQDGGNSWTRHTWGVSDWVSGSCFLDPDYGWVYGGIWPTEEISGVFRYHPSQVLPELAGDEADFSAMVRRTTDGGSSFTTIFDADGFDIRDASFINKNEGWLACSWDDAVNYKSTVYHTIDGGVSWEEQSVPSGSYANINAIHFFNRREGWGAGFKVGTFTVQTVLIHTIDGGQTWVEDAFSTNIGPMNMVWLDESEGWTTGANDFQYSRIVHYQEPARDPKARLTHISPPQNAQPGQTINWTVEVENLTGQTLDGDIWLSITGPAIPAPLYPYSVPLAQGIQIPAGGTGQGPVSLPIPGNAPAGLYDIEILYGPEGSENPLQILGYSQFTLNVQ